MKTVIMKYLSKKTNHDGTVRFKSDFVEQSGGLKTDHAVVISFENKHAFRGITRVDDPLQGVCKRASRPHLDS